MPKLKIFKKIKDTPEQLIALSLVELVEKDAFACSSPTTITISNFSYSVVDILTSTKRYVTGTAQANGLSLTMNCVLDIVSGEIMSNVEALAKFNRGSYLLQTSSEQYAIQS